jgi:hypothetical protein
MQTQDLFIKIEGKYLTNLVRQLYCYENDKAGAYTVLECLKGISIEQARKVCEGFAHLQETSDGKQMQYIEETDYEFRKKYETHAKWLITVWIPQQEEEAIDLQTQMRTTREQFDELSYDTANSELERANLLGQLKSEINRMTQTLPEPSKETITIGGKWNIPKNYLDRYANEVVKQLRDTLRDGGVIAFLSGGAERIYNLEMERQDLHEAICTAVGFDHDAKERSNDQIEFNNALNDYVDKYAGSLFNGSDKDE